MAYRPEFACIDWNAPNGITLANQLWSLYREESDYTYHKALGVAIKTMMQVHHVDNEIAKETWDIMDEWKKAKKAKLFYKSDRAIPKTAEEIFIRKMKKKEANRIRNMNHKKGMNLPLLSYMKLQDATTLSLNALHEEALKYQHMYSSQHSFLKHLRIMWTSLGYTKEQVLRQNQDPRNRICSSWATRRLGESSNPIPRGSAPNMGEVEQAMGTESELYSKDLTGLNSLTMEAMSMMDYASLSNMSDPFAPEGRYGDMQHTCTDQGLKSHEQDRADSSSASNDDDYFLPSEFDTQYGSEEDDMHMSKDILP